MCIFIHEARVPKLIQKRFCVCTDVMLLFVVVLSPFIYCVFLSRSFVCCLSIWSSARVCHVCLPCRFCVSLVSLACPLCVLLVRLVRFLCVSSGCPMSRSRCPCVSLSRVPSVSLLLLLIVAFVSLGASYVQSRLVS